MRILNVDAPLWFIQCEIGIQLIFAIVTLLVAFYAYRVYRIARQKNSFYLGAGFLSISIAYFIQAFFNFLLLRRVTTCGFLSFMAGHPVQSTMTLSVLVVFLHMVFMVAGFSVLSYITLKERNIKSFYLILALSIASLVFAANMSIMFYVLLTIMLAFITIQYSLRFNKKPTTDTFIVFLGFGMVFLGTIQLALASALGALYVSGHIVTLAGYFLLLINLMRVVRK
ncbi:hypothetical protein JXA48_02130 [Candidatus Woesearchaeota archaeon]|nr:hypothetical protein [Candidatus Woesearchaeota archaeon]